METSPEVFLVRERLQQTGVDAFFDIHGDEGLPYVFVAGGEMLPGFTPEQAQAQSDFIADFKRASPDFPGRARLLRRQIQRGRAQARVEVGRATPTAVCRSRSRCLSRTTPTCPMTECRLERRAQPQARRGDAGAAARGAAMRSLFFAAAAAACLLGSAASAQEAKPYQPVMGQKGKDVVWIPSPTGMVDLMLDAAKVTPQDFVVDLGSGDGRNVIAAAKRGARALGVEFNPELVELSKRNAAAAGVADKASFVQGDMFAADISQATALILFLIPQNLEKLAPKFIALKPGTRIVSNTYEIGGGWEPDDSQRLPLCASWCGAHLYIVPAKAAGTWRLPGRRSHARAGIPVRLGQLRLQRHPARQSRTADCAERKSRSW